MVGRIGANADAGDQGVESVHGGASASVSCQDYLDSIDGGILHASCTGGDCAGGLVCCGCFTLSPGPMAASFCAPASCVVDNYQLCASDAECLEGTCQALPVSGYSLCAATGDAGVETHGQAGGGEEGDSAAEAFDDDDGGGAEDASDCDPSCCSASGCCFVVCVTPPPL
jgi:hypothetical protein